MEGQINGSSVGPIVIGVLTWVIGLCSPPGAHTVEPCEVSRTASQPIFVFQSLGYAVETSFCADTLVRRSKTRFHKKPSPPPGEKKPAQRPQKRRVSMSTLSTQRSASADTVPPDASESPQSQKSSLQN